MATLEAIRTEIRDIIQDTSYDSFLKTYINNAITTISGGIRMPDGGFSPPLPQLFDTDTVATTPAAYAELPADYQRNVFSVCDSSGLVIKPASGGDYYNFRLFLKQCYKKDLTETGTIHDVAVKGKRLYYQGIPAASKNLTVMFYRKPVELINELDQVDGIPEQFQAKLIKHYVCQEIFGSELEDGSNSRGAGNRYHMSAFFKTMQDLISFIGEDEEPIYYASSNESVW